MYCSKCSSVIFVFSRWTSVTWRDDQRLENRTLWHPGQDRRSADLHGIGRWPRHGCHGYRLKQHIPGVWSRWERVLRLMFKLITYTRRLSVLNIAELCKKSWFFLCFCYLICILNAIMQFKVIFISMLTSLINIPTSYFVLFFIFYSCQGLLAQF